jgi:hypothetical protein
MECDKTTTRNAMSYCNPGNKISFQACEPMNSPMIPTQLIPYNPSKYPAKSLSRAFRFPLLTTLLSAILALGTLGCESEKSRLKKMVAQELEETQLSYLKKIPNSRLEKVDVDITMQSGLEFTGTAVAKFALDPLFIRLGPRDPEFASLREEMKKSFKKSLDIRNEEMSFTEDKLFRELFDSINKQLGPAYQRVEFRGTPIEIKFPAIDGRRSGDKVKITRIDSPELNVGEYEEILNAAEDKAPVDAKLYANFKDFDKKFRKDFAKSLKDRSKELRERLVKDAEKFQNALLGVWQGQVEERIIDQKNITIMAEFSEDKSCSIVLAVDSVIRGFGVSKFRDRVHLKGTWETSPASILATARQVEWSQESQHSDGPGRTGPEEKSNRKLSDQEFIFYFAYNPENELVTYMPMNTFYPSEKTQIVSADDYNLSHMLPIKMEKIENPLENGNH